MGTDYAVYYPLLVGAIAFGILWWGNLRYLEYFFLFLVALMSVCFVTTAILVKPLWSDLFEGLFVPALPEGSLFSVIA